MKLFLFDLETTGTDAVKNGVHQISGRIIINGEVKENFDFKVRPCKGWFMTMEDAETLEKMEFPLTVYRAYDPYYDTPEGLENGGDPGISWTTDKEWCEEYAKGRGRIVKSRTVERKDVFAYVSRRGEEEIMIL